MIDGTGKFLIPGLTDSHLHLTGAGEPTREAAISSFRYFSPTELRPFATWAAISNRLFLFAKKSAAASGLAPDFLSRPVS